MAGWPPPSLSPHKVWSHREQAAGRERSACGAVQGASPIHEFIPLQRGNTATGGHETRTFPYGAEPGRKPKGSGSHVHVLKRCAQLDDVMTSPFAKSTHESFAHVILPTEPDGPVTWASNVVSVLYVESLKPRQASSQARMTQGLNVPWCSFPQESRRCDPPTPDRNRGLSSSSPLYPDSPGR